MATPWADQPFELLPIPGQAGAATSSNPGCLYVAWDMANVHNALLRGLNAIYMQCEHVHEPADIADFILYIKAWGDGVHHHHHGEETDLFPRFDELARAAGETESVMDQNVKQHHDFQHGFEKLREYAADVQGGKKEYDGKRVKTIIDEFAPVFTQHLHEEVKTLLGLEKYDGTIIKQVFDAHVKKAVRTADVHFFIPLMFGCVDKTAPGSENFPAVPFFLSWLNKLWFSRKYHGSWRFNPCDPWGKPRPLQFLGPAT